MLVHTGEYGVHWNFFFTLAAVSILTSIINIPPQYSGILGVAILIGIIPSGIGIINGKLAYWAGKLVCGYSVYPITLSPTHLDPDSLDHGPRSDNPNISPHHQIRLQFPLFNCDLNTISVGYLRALTGESGLNLNAKKHRLMILQKLAHAFSLSLCTLETNLGWHAWYGMAWVAKRTSKNPNAFT
ncbi:unnamed protein product [Dovyalis caffra]|uniref:Uncharacterized protein n=1 Tax=Dovyalis caffra TaxID=77055 RepID=A0AAV1SQ83_9ROSI|nr:unnamed protein product [Dovyalis caffra]